MANSISQAAVKRSDAGVPLFCELVGSTHTPSGVGWQVSPRSAVQPAPVASSHAVGMLFGAGTHSPTVFEQRSPSAVNQFASAG